MTTAVGNTDTGANTPESVWKPYTSHWASEIPLQEMLQKAIMPDNSYIPSIFSVFMQKLKVMGQERQKLFELCRINSFDTEAHVFSMYHKLLLLLFSRSCNRPNLPVICWMFQTLSFLSFCNFLEPKLLLFGTFKRTERFHDLQRLMQGRFRIHLAPSRKKWPWKWLPIYTVNPFFPVLDLLEVHFWKSSGGLLRPGGQRLDLQTRFCPRRKITTYKCSVAVL